jgi:hypothetical protein
MKMQRDEVFSTIGSPQGSSSSYDKPGMFMDANPLWLLEV